MTPRTLACTFLTFAILAAIPASGQITLQPDSRRECATCHLEWVDDFNNPQAVLLLDKPAKLKVADEDTCLGCHDGSMEDSRLKVWTHHGHKTNITPPATMQIPRNLPLEDGKVVCRTCHTGHGGSPDNGTMFFSLRDDDGHSHLCKSCHTDKLRGPQLGSHPVGGMPFPVPQALIDAGAHAKPGEMEIFCQVCHTAHGSKQERLLVMGVSDNSLCLNCHKQLRPGMWRANRPGVHPDRPVVQSTAQREAIERMHTRLGDENRLICLSCHKLHDGHSGRFLLAMDLKGSKFCLQCHPDHASLNSTMHDLGRSNPKAENRLGMTVEQAGPCSACHMFHNLARRPNPTDIDPLGLCSSCHVAGGLAGKLGTMKATHPAHDSKGEEIACRKCHNPHGTEQPKFLKEPSSNLCRSCHAEKMHDIQDSVHDATKWTGSIKQDPKQDNKCFACHKIHGWDDAKQLWTVPPAADGPKSDATCRGCHKAVHWPTSQPWSTGDMIHPREKGMLCKSCHDPHAGPQTVKLLIGSTAAHPAVVCLKCHKNAEFIEQSMHSRRALERDGIDPKTVCGPCHAVHAVKGSHREKLWAAGSDNSTRDRCMVCHSPGGTAKKPRLTSHPEEPLQSLGLSPITCLTCHLTHGMKTDLPDNVSLKILSASKPMLRSGVAQTLCVTCHTDQAERRFLYFHFPEKRKK